MIVKTLLFFLLLYILIRVIGRLFLPSPDNRNHPFFIFRNFYKRQQEHGDKKRRRLEDIEEAEYEDITEEKSSKEE